ncbi:MAG: PAS domain-containing protein, partial [Peptococcaceae bacterium]|nr:PAS domain-containing protein [Peptococcaceae bacterium]
MELGRVEFESILDKIEDAVLAIDAAANITLLNTAGRKLIGCGDDVIGKPVTEVIASTRLPEVLRSGVAELNQQQKLSETGIVTNRFPLYNQAGLISGAVAIFHDLSEVKSLKDQIS